MMVACGAGRLLATDREGTTGNDAGEPLRSSGVGAALAAAPGGRYGAARMRIDTTVQGRPCSLTESSPSLSATR